MRKIINIILAPFRALRTALIAGLLKLRAKLQIASMRDAIKEADTLHEETGKKYLVVYNKATKEWEPIAKQQLKAAHKRHKAFVRGKVKDDGITLERAKQIEKRSVYAS